MKHLLFTGIIAIMCVSLVFASKLSMVKLVKSKTLVLNGDYINRDTYYSEVLVVNQTYNSLVADYEIIQDFPCNTILNVTVLRANLNHGNLRKIRDYTVTLCNNKSKYFKCLPDAVIELNRQGLCVPQGEVKTKGHEYFKFYDLLSIRELKNARFKMISTYETQKEVVYSVGLDFVSNKI